MSALFIRNKEGNFERVPAYSGGGASSWEDLGSTFEKVNVLDECSPIFSEDEGMFVLIDPIEVIADQGYTVNWNGVPYKTTAAEIPTDSGMIMTVLGDAGMVTTGEPTTGEPFAIAVIPADMVEMAGYGAGIFPLDGSVEVTLSIVGNIETVTPIPMKYIPKMSCCIDLAEEDFTQAGQSNNLTCFIDAYDTTELYNVIINFGQIWLQVAETKNGENIFYRRVQITMVENPIPCRWEDVEAVLEANGATDVDISSLTMELTGYDPFKERYYRININTNN